MKNRKWVFFALLFAVSLFFVQCSSIQFLSQKQSHEHYLQEQIKFLLSDPSLANAHIGIYIESLQDGHVVFEQNPFKLMIPASNMKLFTTAAALVNLGPAFRFKTGVYYSGQLKDSTLIGDLIIKGSGDPSISGRFYQNDYFAVFKQWVDSLKKQGISKINGNLIGDNSLFKNPVIADGWNWDDLPFWYAAQTSALSFNDNCVDFRIWPDSVPGGHVHFKMSPGYDSVRVVNKAIVVDSSAENTLKIRRIRGNDVVIISGNLPVNADTVSESITVEAPGRYFLSILKKVLTRQGIEVSGTIRLISDSLDYTAAKRLFTHYSPPLPELIKVLNKLSHNFYAEQLLKTMGAIFNREGSFTAGCQFVDDWLMKIGVPEQYFLNVDGSGLSRKNFVAPIATATLLRYLYHHPYFKYYYDSLPIAGVDGTIKKRMKGTLAQGNVHAKTGYVQHMRALSGYVNVGRKDPMLFVMMFNNYSVPTPHINDIQDKICILLSN